MRIGILLEQCLAPVPGGTGRYAAEVARALAATRGDGDEVGSWTAWHRDVGAATAPGVHGPVRLPLPRRLLVTTWERAAHPRPRQVDVVHAPTLLAPLGGRVPVVVTIHDAVPWTHPETLTRRGVAWHRRAAARAAQHADRIIVPTRAVAVGLEHHLHPRCPVEVVGEGVSPGLAAPVDAAERRRALGLPSGGYLLTTATLEPRKGLDVLVRALALSAAPDLSLVVVGQPGWGAVDLPALTAAAGLPDGRVRALGRLPDADLAAAIGGAAAVVVPSLAEGFGLPVLEGMAAGVPVVSSDDPALVEVGGGATVVTAVGDPADLAEGLARATAAGEPRRDLVRRGRERAAEFSWEGAARRLWEVYRGLVQDGRR